MNLIISLIFASVLSAQSFQDKPVVPVLYVHGEDKVVVDCYDNEAQIWTRHFLNRTSHPSVFESEVKTQNDNAMDISVSLLKSENTLTLTLKPEGSDPLTIETYGTECGFTTPKTKVYCSVFQGELEEN